MSANTHGPKRQSNAPEAAGDLDAPRDLDLDLRGDGVGAGDGLPFPRFGDFFREALLAGLFREALLAGLLDARLRPRLVDRPRFGVGSSSSSSSSSASWRFASRRELLRLRFDCPAAPDTFAVCPAYAESGGNQVRLEHEIPGEPIIRDIVSAHLPFPPFAQPR